MSFAWIVSNPIFVSCLESDEIRCALNARGVYLALTWEIYISQRHWTFTKRKQKLIYARASMQ